jgi:hypothetical protein
MGRHRHQRPSASNDGGEVISKMSMLGSLKAYRFKPATALRDGKRKGTDWVPVLEKQEI